MTITVNFYVNQKRAETAEMVAVPAYQDYVRLPNFSEKHFVVASVQWEIGTTTEVDVYLEEPEQ